MRFYLILIIVSSWSILSGQVIVQEKSKIITVTSPNDYFPNTIDSLRAGVKVLYLLEHHSRKDPLTEVSLKDKKSGYTLVATAIYLNGNLVVLELPDNDIFNSSLVSYHLSGHFLATAQYSAKGFLESCSIDDVTYEYDSLQNITAIRFSSISDVEGQLTECIDSVRNFSKSGRLESKEFYIDCKKDGIWEFFNTEEVIIKRQQYSKGVLIKEEVY